MPDDVPCYWCGSSTLVVGSNAHEVYHRCPTCDREFKMAVPGGGRPIGWMTADVDVSWIADPPPEEETWRDRPSLL